MIELQELPNNKNSYSTQYEIMYNKEKTGYIRLKPNKSSVLLECIVIDSNYKRKGIGRLVIKYLLSKYGVIIGECYAFALGFWQKMNCEFEINIDVLNKEEMLKLIEEDILISFSIKQ